MAYTNPNTVLNGFDKLNQFLSIEVAKKEKQDRIDKVNNTSDQILSKFQSLGPNAKPADLQRIYLQALDAGAKSGVLKDIAPIAGAAYTSTLQAIQATKKAADLSKFKDYAQNEAPWANLGGVPADMVPSAFNIAKGTLKETTEYRDDGSHLVIHKLGDGFGQSRVIGDFSLGDKNKQDLKNYELKRQLDYKYGLGLAVAKSRLKNGGKNGTGAKPSDYASLAKTSYNTMTTLAPSLMQSIAPAEVWNSYLGIDDVNKLSSSERIAIVNDMLSHPEKMQEIFNKGKNPIDYGNANDPRDAVVPFSWKGAKYSVNGHTVEGTLVPKAALNLFEQFQNATEYHQRALKLQADALLPTNGAANMQTAAFNRAEQQVENALNGGAGVTASTYLGIEKALRAISGDTKSSPKEIWDNLPEEQKQYAILMMSTRKK